MFAQAFLVHALAGAAAGMAETAVMYPVDTIKTRLQVTSSDSLPDTIHFGFQGCASFICSATGNVPHTLNVLNNTTADV